MEYPKINSLYKRELNRDRSLVIGSYSCEEFASINRWIIDEKIDGTNIRIMRNPNGDLYIGGRTERAQISCNLLSYLNITFNKEILDKVFQEDDYGVCPHFILYGEGYGTNIQSGGYYRKDVSFILFDVFMNGWWLQKEDVMIIADKLGIEHTPIISKSNLYVDWTIPEIVEYVKSKPRSIIAQDDHEIEGIIARAHPQMLFRTDKLPIMFKLKCKDFN
jgi:ATP-dependent RNA circularization protein (DNA/RNA ligase family)